MKLELSTDKFFWHEYMDEYERLVFKEVERLPWWLVGNQNEIEAKETILEFGVFEGDSIQFWLNRFPYAEIYGVDIFDPDEYLPTLKIDNPRFHYIKQDQGDRAGIREMFKRLNIKFDLIVDDGSHNPLHQAFCLSEGFSYVNHGGFYIVEDIHTAFRRDGVATIFHVLQAIKHRRKQPLVENTISNLSGFFTAEEIKTLENSIEDLHMIRRAHLPIKCWRC